MENSNYKNENTERNQLKEPIFKRKEQSFRIRKRFYRIGRQEIKRDRIKIKREIEELYFKPIIVSVDDVNKFEEKEMKNIGPIKNTWLIHCISKVTRKITGGFKDEVVSFFKTNIPKQTMYRRGKKLSKPKAQNKIKKKE